MEVILNLLQLSQLKILSKEFKLKDNLKKEILITNLLQQQKDYKPIENYFTNGKNCKSPLKKKYCFFFLFQFLIRFIQYYFFILSFSIIRQNHYFFFLFHSKNRFISYFIYLVSNVKTIQYLQGVSKK